jgi:hypothetical protein
MKKPFLIALATVASLTFVNAQTATPSAEKTTVQQEEKVKIKSDELPESVKTSLNGDQYKGWQIDAAYQYKTSGNFEVMLKNGTESKTVKFDKDGNKID